MAVFQHTLVFRTSGRGTYEITEQVREAVRTCGIRTGMVSLFCQHTSCSLVVMENADPTARRDLEAWLDRLVAEDDPLFEHTLEGSRRHAGPHQDGPDPDQRDACRSQTGHSCSEPGRDSFSGNIAAHRMRGIWW
jgi:thiamine phosphate synthase YjbQ (UPF0047 family)